MSDGRPRRLEELPGETRALRQTAPVLAHLGLLVGDGERWALSDTGQEIYGSGALTLRTAQRMFGDYSRFDAVVTQGGPVRAADGSSRVTEGGVREEDKQGARDFMDMLYRRSAVSAVQSATWLCARLHEGAHVLDLGGGHGRYGEELVKRGCRVTLFDRPVCVDIARERYGDQLRYQEGNFLEDELGGPFDAAYLSNIVHGLGPDENTRVFQAIHRALKPGGLLVLKDMFLGEHGAHPEEAVFFNLTMLMYTREGRSYSAGEMGDIAAAAGFSKFEHLYVSDCNFSLLIAKAT
jgi:SAM-dependent methyltransferase